jgi:hypothetical protein
MGKGKPYSDAEIRPETPEILRVLEKQHYKSPEWSRDAGIKNRGLGIVEVDDGAAGNVYQIDSIPPSSRDAKKESK